MSNRYLEKIAAKAALPLAKPVPKPTTGFLGLHKYHQHKDEAIFKRLASMLTSI